MKRIIIIMGSDSDRSHADRIVSALEKDPLYDTAALSIEIHTASAHKNPLRVLEILESAEAEQTLLFITIAGRSNALSGFCAANTDKPVIACPPFADKVDMMVNINSTLQMPSNTPVLTVLDPGNAALAALRILSLADRSRTAGV